MHLVTSLMGTSRGPEALYSNMNHKSVLYWPEMLRGQWGYWIRQELAIQTPGYPLYKKA